MRVCRRVEATRRSMAQITGALIGIATVLSAVFIPMAFLRRLDRRDLPAVLDHDRLGDGAVGDRGPGADAGAVRDTAQAGGARRASRPAAGFFRWFNQFFERSSAALPRRGGAHARAARTLPGDLSGAGLDHGAAVRAIADGVSAG